MPTLKADLVELSSTWAIPLPDIPQNLRVVDLQEALRNYDAKLTRDAMVSEAWTKTWGKKKITFGTKHRGKPYGEVYADDPLYCDWIRTGATHMNDAMKQFIQYIEIREEMRAAQHPGPEEEIRWP